VEDDQPRGADDEADGGAFEKSGGAGMIGER
jgi:hypothetical protein